jgi:four helix bundle protein
MSGMNIFDEWKDRTKKFALRIINVYRSLPNDKVAQTIGNQLLRSGTSVAANYRAACRGRSTAERYSKLCIVVEEADETEMWLELLIEANIVSADKLKELLHENQEIIKFMNTSKFNAKSKK